MNVVTTIKSYKDKSIAFLLGVILLFFNFFMPTNILITGIIAILVLTMPLDRSVIIYLFLFPWEHSLSIPVLGTVNTLIAIIIVTKLLCAAYKGVNCGFTKYNVLLLLFLSIYALINFVLYQSIAGFGVLLDAFILIYIYKLKKENKEFWETVFTIYIISTLFACGYGILHNTFKSRWISGLGYVPQFHGTVGTSRMAIFINMAILFTLTLQYSKVRKALLLVFLYVMLLLTISMAGFIVNVMLIIYYLFFIYPNKDKKRIKLIQAIIILILFITIFSVFYVFKDNIIIVNAMYTRVRDVINNFLLGQANKATSGRVDIYLGYMTKFTEMDLLNKVFGVGSFSPYHAFGFEKYSHNTYIDLLYLGGYCLLLCFTALFVYLIYKERNNKYFRTILFMKIILLINAVNVSMLTSGFWYLWVFL